MKKCNTNNYISNKHDKFTTTFSLFIHNSLTKITRGNTLKNLGVSFDENLTFKPHIQSITDRSNKLFGAACITI